MSLTRAPSLCSRSSPLRMRANTAEPIPIQARCQVGHDLMGKAHEGRLLGSHLPGFLAGQRVGDHREGEQDQGGAEREDAHPRMDDPDDREEDRHPGGIEHRGDLVRPEIALHRLEIGQHLLAEAVATLECRMHRPLQQFEAQRPFQPGADAGEDRGADRVERTERDHRHGADQGEVNECIEAAGEKHRS